GHGVTQEVYQNNGSPEPPGGLHEGNSDVIANFIDRNPVIGYGFSSSTGCGSGIRNAVNGLTYPANNENGGHTAGQVIAGFHWLAWQNMLASLTQAEADQTAFDTWHFARDMGTPQTFPAQVLWTFMMDDDDANLDNGTPHYDYFCPAAEQKGFTCPEILVGVLINHDRLGHVTGAGGSDYDVVATIVSTAAALDPSLLELHWRVDGGAYQTTLLTATGNPDEYSASIPALPKDGQVEYYLSAEDVVGNSRNDPPTAPGTAYAFDVCSVYEDAEGDISGWSLGVGGDTATTGTWERVDPIGTAAQPEDDTTTGAGTQCFVTGQCSGPLCSGGCTLGCNDIDGGTTTLLSPVWDMTGKVNVKVKFEHWYSNNTGAEPNADNWVIDISNDGGSSWTNVLNTAANFAWTTDLVDVDILFGTPGQIRLRFIASDLAGGSVVEAAVDDVRILAETQATDAPVIGGGTVASVVTLDAAQPNPFRETTNLAFALPQRADVSLRVYNVQGQMVRELVHGVQDAGRHVAEWDGRDSAGNRVATGVYFYRLDANERTLTRKMTVMK
ncbi:MAG: T9SS type A sorting domain-containing protein, partial [Gemmatimonadetes bacterium]|nr:T9SS type A sorting domain-containing protein [Gemmatimonadota bacterium]